MHSKELLSLVRWESSARVVAKAAVDLGQNPQNVQVLKNTFLSTNGIPRINIAQELKNFPQQPPESTLVSPPQK